MEWRSLEKGQNQRQLQATFYNRGVMQPRYHMMDRISVNSQIHFGKPCIAGTRITVQSVLELLSEGLSFEEIIRGYYSDLKVEDIIS